MFGWVADKCMVNECWIDGYFYDVLVLGKLWVWVANWCMHVGQTARTVCGDSEWMANGLVVGGGWWLVDSRMLGAGWGWNEGW